MIATLIDGFRDWREVAITAFGSLGLFFLLMAFVKTWMRGGA